MHQRWMRLPKKTAWPWPVNTLTLPNDMLQDDGQRTPEVFVFFGMIATGKSTIAQAWSWQEQLRCYNSDWVRKELAGVDPTSPHHELMEQGIYTKEFSIKTYATLHERAATRIRQGNLSSPTVT